MAEFQPTGSGLERARLAAGLSLAEVAAVVCRDRATCRRWETGYATPSKPVMLRLADLYGCTVADLVDA